MDWPLQKEPAVPVAARLALFLHVQWAMKNVPNKPAADAKSPEERRTSFTVETVAEHLKHKISSWRHIRKTHFLVILSSPLIYGCVLPFLMVDASVALYQSVCFPIYGIPKVRRKDYLVFDRGHLAYLNTIEKVGCIYCSYVNGLLAMISEIAARTEQHFCPIKHARRLLKPHSRYNNFLPYGDAIAYRSESDKVAGAFNDISKC